MSTSQVLQHLYSLDTSSPDLLRYLYYLIQNDDEDQYLSSLQGSELTRLVDFLDGALDVIPITDDVSRRCLHKLQAICGRHKILPSSYNISGDLTTIDDDPVASGGFSDVWEGTYDGKKVCIKRLRITQQTRKVIGKAFCKEAVMWKRLKHPNIVGFIGVTQKPLRFVSEWMPNGTLTEYLSENPGANRIGLLLDVAEGLTFLHAIYTTHGDLKGPNVLIDHTGHARLTDFGFTSVVRGVNSVLVTEVQGYSARWAAPEVLENGDQNTREADVFAFGMIVIEVFTGSHPFSEFTALVAVSKIIAGERPDRPQEPGLTDIIWDMTLRSWTQDPAHRPTMASVVGILRECSRSCTPSLHLLTSTPPAMSVYDAEGSTSISVDGKITPSKPSGTAVTNHSLNLSTPIDREPTLLRQFKSHDTTLLATSSSTASPPTLKGYLQKYTNVVRGYSTRWFVLKDGTLSYYRHQEDENISSRGSIAMKTVVLKVAPGSNEQRFEIHYTPSRGHQIVQKWYLKADHPVEGTRWTTMIRKNIDWYKQKEQRELASRMSESSLRAPSMRSLGSTHTGPISLSSRNTKSTFSKGKELSGSISDNGNGGPGSETCSVSGIFGDSPTVTLPRIVASLEKQEDGDGSPDDSSADDTAESSRPPFEDTFKIQENYVQIQTKLISDYLHALLHTAPSAADLNRTLSQLKDNVGNIDSTLEEYLGMVQKREKWWAARLKAEQERQDVWEASLKTVVEEGEALERELKSRGSRRRSRMFSSEHGDWRHSTLKAKTVSTPPPRMGTTSPPHLAAGEVFTLSPEPTPSIETTFDFKVPVSLADLTAETVTATTTPSTSASLTAPEMSAANDPVSAATITAFTPPNAGRRLPLTGSSNTPTFRHGSPEVDEINTDEEDEEIDEFFDAIDAGTLPMIVSPALHIHGEKFLELEKNQYSGYANVRQRLDLDADNRPPTSLWAILKNAIGKDLTRISFPVFFNEPTSMLQRMAEDMEFPQCLDAAAEERDPLMRIAYVAAFAMSNYSSTFGRIAKPFNPMLGETFEYVDLKQQYRYISEQVSHHPPISACWAESPTWRYYGEVDAQSKFVGKSYEIRPTGIAHADLILSEEWAPDYPRDKHPRNVGKVIEHYSWKKVITSISGFMLGTPTIDHYGEMIVTNHRTKDQCRMTFKPRGWRGKDAYEVSGFVISSAGKQVFKVAGKWTKQLIACPIGSGEDGLYPDMDVSESQSTQNVLLWKNSEKPAAPFNLTPFAITLNHCPEDTLQPFVCPTDCRLRPDQRAFELGRYEHANALKAKQEDKQRATRKAREEKKIPPHRPRWFMAETEPDTGERYWAPSKVGEELEYWLERERVWKAKTNGDTRASWKGVNEIFIGDEP